MFSGFQRKIKQTLITSCNRCSLIKSASAFLCPKAFHAHIDSDCYGQLISCACCAYTFTCIWQNSHRFLYESCELSDHCA